MSRVSTPPAAKPVTNTGQLPHERIAMRAYEKWMKRGCPQGTALQDWIEAEAELRAEGIARHGSRDAIRGASLIAT